MIELTAIVRNGTIHPAGPWNAELLEKAVAGREYKVRLTRARSVPQNALYWVWLARVAQSTGMQVDWLHNGIKLALGKCDTFVDLNGRPQVMVGSTAFDKMDADEFKGYFDSAVSIIDEKFDGAGSAIMQELGK